MSEQRNHLRAEALFVSTMHRSSQPAPDEVRRAIAVSLREFGSQGCAARVAGEFGEYPDTAPARMTWALQAVRTSFTSMVGTTA